MKIALLSILILGSVTAQASVPRQTRTVTIREEKPCPSRSAAGLFSKTAAVPAKGHKGTPETRRGIGEGRRVSTSRGG